MILGLITSLSSLLNFSSIFFIPFPSSSLFLCHLCFPSLLYLICISLHIHPPLLLHGKAKFLKQNKCPKENQANEIIMSIRHFQINVVGCLFSGFTLSFCLCATAWWEVLNIYLIWAFSQGIWILSVKTQHASEIKIFSIKVLICIVYLMSHLFPLVKLTVSSCHLTISCGTFLTISPFMVHQPGY